MMRKKGRKTERRARGGAICSAPDLLSREKRSSPLVPFSHSRHLKFTALRSRQPQESIDYQRQIMQTLQLSEDKREFPAHASDGEVIGCWAVCDGINALCGVVFFRAGLPRIARAVPRAADQDGDVERTAWHRITRRETE
eukprot:3329888-Rhodomonas_salina.2